MPCDTKGKRELMDNLGLLSEYNIPYRCRACGGVMVFKGVGEYQCEDCKSLDYDDYGKVRLYIEENKGATAMEIEDAIGVPQKKIRRMLREKRIQVAADSKCFIHCELCGKNIRCGQFCDDCEMKYHRAIEARQRELLDKELRGIGMGTNGDEGHRRFMRKEDFRNEK